MKIVYNFKGEILTKPPELQDQSFGQINEYGDLIIDWEKEDELCDTDGFDKTYRPYKDSDIYVIKDYVIPRGTILCRYGLSTGRFTSIKGVTYESLGLPYINETVEYHEYIVSEKVSVDCLVIKGRVAAKFNSDGGAIQFKHKRTILEEIIMMKSFVILLKKLVSI